MQLHRRFLSPKASKAEEGTEKRWRDGEKCYCVGESFDHRNCSSLKIARTVINAPLVTRELLTLHVDVKRTRYEIIDRKSVV